MSAQKEADVMKETLCCEQDRQVVAHLLGDLTPENETDFRSPVSYTHLTLPKTPYV